MAKAERKNDMRKFELTNETKKVGEIILHRVKAVVDFGYVEAGDCGGWIEKEENLAQNGDAWVSGNAWVFGNARVFGDAWVSGNARVGGNARVFGDAWVSGNARVGGDARVSGNARVFGDAWVFGNARVFGDAWVSRENHLLVVFPIGSRDDTITFTRDKNGCIYTKIGCFAGTLTEFRKKVKKTHGKNIHAKAYLLVAQLAELRIDTTPIQGDDEEIKVPVEELQ